MYEEKRILAVIPARGGSKGIKNKNIIDLVGKPLIAYSIECAKKSKYIDSIVVSTDSEKIADIARKYGAEIPFLRPKELATDHAKTIDAICHLLNHLEDKYDTLVLLQPTGPLRKTEEVDQALELFFESALKSVVSVSEVKDNPVLMRKIDSNGRMEKIWKMNSTVRRQDMEKIYRVNGSIYINNISEINTNTSFNDNEIPYIMPVEDSVDIDGWIDLQMAKFYICKSMGRENFE